MSSASRFSKGGNVQYVALIHGSEAHWESLGDEERHPPYCDSIDEACQLAASFPQPSTIVRSRVGLSTEV
jgi:hypothetical protein